MNNVIVTDIFGRTPALETLARDIGSVAAIIDPYDKASMNFAAEPLAYEYFMTHVGIFAYKQLIAARLAESARIDLLIGFSVGLPPSGEFPAAFLRENRPGRVFLWLTDPARHRYGPPNPHGPYPAQKRAGVRY